MIKHQWEYSIFSASFEWQKAFILLKNKCLFINTQFAAKTILPIAHYLFDKPHQIYPVRFGGE